MPEKLPIDLSNFEVVGFVRLYGDCCVPETTRPENGVWIFLSSNHPGLCLGIILDESGYKWTLTTGGKTKVLGEDWRFYELLPDLLEKDLDILRQRCTEYCEQF